MKRKKITSDKLQQLENVPNLFLQYKSTKLSKKPLIGTEKQVKFLRKIYNKSTFDLREEAVVIVFGGNYIPIGYFSVTVGDKRMVNIDVDYIFQMLYLSGANGFILSHNHPSASSEPSQADLDVTIGMKLKADFLDFEFYDHIVLNDKKHFSFADNGLVW